MANTHLPVSQLPTQAAPPETGPAIEPRREMREVLEAIQADCRLNPDEYLKEVYVPGGGE
ncbi:MAG: hypothetical protein IT429_22190 [Gemmataceae bacterium]|nr:hypothetical protein [Gemmataceae bacterium]